MNTKEYFLDAGLSEEQIECINSVAKESGFKSTVESCLYEVALRSARNKRKPIDELNSKSFEIPDDVKRRMSDAKNAEDSELDALRKSNKGRSYIGDFGNDVEDYSIDIGEDSDIVPGSFDFCEFDSDDGSDHAERDYVLPEFSEIKHSNSQSNKSWIESVPKNKWADLHNFISEMFPTVDATEFMNSADFDTDFYNLLSNLSLDDITESKAKKIKWFLSSMQDYLPDDEREHLVTLNSKFNNDDIGVDNGKSLSSGRKTDFFGNAMNSRDYMKMKKQASLDKLKEKRSNSQNRPLELTPIEDEEYSDNDLVNTDDLDLIAASMQEQFDHSGEQGDDDE